MTTDQGNETIEVYAERDLPAGLRSQVNALQQQAWPQAEYRDGPQHDPLLDPLVMLTLDGDRVIASLTVLSTTIWHVARPWRVSGLSVVVVDETHRGTGTGSRLVSAARARIAAGDTDLGLFTCDRPLQAFYRRCGWNPLAGTVLIGGTPKSPLASDSPGFDKVTMAGFFSGAAVEQRAHFEQCRIELYPGEIDRLW